MDIKFALNEKLQYILHKNRLRMIKMTEYDKLKQFFNSVHPVYTGHELIRIGPEFDGGYLLPDDFENVKTCFSPGVEQKSFFELAMAERGITSFMADYSVDGPVIDNPLFHFEKKFLGSVNNDMYMTLEDWVTRNAPDDNELVMQMDIEACEYEVIYDTSPEILSQFRMMNIEFHRLGALLGRDSFEYINLAFQKLLKIFDIIHIHPNNSRLPVVYREFEIPRNIEVTFLRKDRVSSRTPIRNFPHPLDSTNVPRFVDYPLPKCWYEQ